MPCESEAFFLCLFLEEERACPEVLAEPCGRSKAKYYREAEYFRGDGWTHQKKKSNQNYSFQLEIVMDRLLNPLIPKTFSCLMFVQ